VSKRDPTEAGLEAAFGRADNDSVLFRLSRQGKPVPANGQPVAADRYETVGELARGGVGIVFKTRDTDLGREVAMKVMRPELGTSPELLHRFVEEAQIGGQLQHPGIIPVYELGLRPDERAFFTMKLIKGGTLAELLGERAGPGENRHRLLGVFRQVCDTISYAHARGVVHRDLKPANIMVGSFGEVIVVDWGFAKVIARGGVADERRTLRSANDTVVRTVRTGSQGSAAESRAGSVMGTPAYMPPEQALGQIEQVDRRSDVFALGAILCEILTGDPPYRAASGDPMLQAARSDLSDAFARLEAAHADASLVDLARTCLAPEPQDRPRDAGAVAEAVAGYMRTVAERARRAEIAAAEAEEQAVAARRHRRLGLALAAAALLAVLAGGWTWDRFAAAREQRADEARRAVRAALGDVATAEGGAGPEAMEVWDDAQRAMRRALELAAAPDVSPDLRAEVDQAAARQERERAADAAIVRQRASDADFLRRHMRLYISRHRGVLRAEKLATGDDYRRLFREYLGLDVLETADEQVAAAVRESRMPRELVEALDVWATLETGYEQPQEPNGAHLVRIARLADPDPWRDRLRAAGVAGDADALAELADTIAERIGDRVSITLLSQFLSDAGQADRALELLRKGIEHHPDGYRLLLRIAELLAWAQDPPEHGEAMGFLRAAHALEPDQIDPLLGLAKSQEAMGDTSAAIATRNVLLERIPDGFAIYGSQVRLYEQEGLLDKEIAALQDKQDDWIATTRLGIAVWQKGDIEAATEAMLRAIRLRPEDPVPHFYLAALYDRAKEWNNAVKKYADALEREPAWYSPHAGLAKVYQRAGELERAERHARRAIALSPRHLDNRQTLCSILGELCRFDEAEAEARRAIRINLLDAASWYMLSTIHFSRGQWEEARRLAEKAIECDEDYTDAYMMLSLAHLEKGRFREATQFARRAAMMPPSRWTQEFMKRRAQKFGESLALEPRYAAVKDGDETPSDAKELLGFARIAAFRGDYPTCVRLFRAALNADRALVDTVANHYHWAAYSAIHMAKGLPVELLRPLHRDAQHWLRRFVELGREQFNRHGLRVSLRHMRHGAFLRPVQPRALATLPDDIRETWEAFWDENERLLEITKVEVEIR
jgi:serine/threonine-protein kinase